MKKKLLSLVICCIMLTGCGVKPTQGLSEQDIKSKEDTLKDSQAHVDVEETFITKFDGINAIQLDDEGLLLSHLDTPNIENIRNILTVETTHISCIKSYTLFSELCLVNAVS